jgi:hypothetical protein
MAVGEQKRIAVVDFGRLEGRNLSGQEYRFELVEEVKVMID